MLWRLEQQARFSGKLLECRWRWKTILEVEGWQTLHHKYYDHRHTKTSSHQRRDKYNVMILWGAYGLRHGRRLSLSCQKQIKWQRYSTKQVMRYATWIYQTGQTGFDRKVAALQLILLSQKRQQQTVLVNIYIYISYRYSTIVWFASWRWQLLFGNGISSDDNDSDDSGGGGERRREATTTTAALKLADLLLVCL